MSERTHDVSVLIATFRRPSLLKGTLESVLRAAPKKRTMQVIVVDNADDPETANLCASLRHLLGANVTLTRLVETRPGKNAALNRGLDEAGGDLMLFTDDDVVVDRAWIRSMTRAAERWPRHVYFGGRVLPAWPEEPPGWLRNSRYLSVCFTLLDRECPEGPIHSFVPFGPNLAVRRKVFDQGLRYDDAVGPTAGTSYIMGSEAELVRRLRARGHEPVYVPGSVVRHLVRPEQLRVRWLLRRSVRYGRSVAHKSLQEGRTAPGWPPRHLLREAFQAAGAAALDLARGRGGRAFDRLMDAGTAWGRLRQLREG